MFRAINPDKKTTPTRGNLAHIDPCPICGVRQAAHWRCVRCTSRGHLLGHSDPASPHCDDCRRELAAAEASS